MTDHIEVSVRGKWTAVPKLEANGYTLAVRGSWLKVAFVPGEDYLESEINDPKACVGTLRQRKPGAPRADIFTFSQKPPATVPKFDYSLEWESLAVVSTASFKDWWEKLPQETRKNVRRAQKMGVALKVRALDDELVTEIMGVNNDSPVRQGIPFVHYGKSFEQVKFDQSSFLDRSDFVCAYGGGELIGFLKIAYRGNIASIVQLLPKASQHDKRPANALLAKAIEVCEAKGMDYLTYGNFNYGNKGDSPLRAFKVRNGFQEMLVPRFYAPLTRWGAIGTKLKLYRGLVEILPHRVITAYVGLRARWYDFAQWVRRCSSTSERPNRNRQMERSIPPAGSNPRRSEARVASSSPSPSHRSNQADSVQ